MRWPSDLDAASIGDADQERPLTHGCGASFYAAPEVLLKIPYGLPVDVWALGVVWKELVTSRCQEWIKPPLPVDHSPCLEERLKMCALLAGPINAQTLPGCELLPNWRACADAQLGSVQRLPWPHDLTKLQLAMQPLIVIALHLQPEFRATSGQLKTRFKEFSPQLLPGPRIVDHVPSSAHQANESLTVKVSSQAATPLVIGAEASPGQDALKAGLGSVVTMSNDPTRCDSQCAATPLVIGAEACSGQGAHKAGLGSVVTGFNDPPRCQCDGDGLYCKATGHAKQEKSCTSPSLPGMSFCSECICCQPGCGNRHHKCNHCRQHWHFSERVGIQLRAQRLFREEHAEMMPVDLQAFMELSPRLPFSLLWLMAQLWEPTALQAVVRHSKIKSWEKHGPDPPICTAQDLTEIMADVAGEMSAHHSQDGIGRWHLDILKIQGASRFFGMAAVGQRFGVLVKTEGESGFRKRRKFKGPPSGNGPEITLGLGEDTFMVVRTTTRQAQKLVKHAGSQKLVKLVARCQADGQQAMRAVISALDDLHANLDGWAATGGNYIAPHIKRKFIMLLSRQFEFQDDIQNPACWPRNIEGLKAMAHGAPDVKGHFDEQVPSFARGRLAWAIVIGLECPPLSMTMWLCFYGYVVAQHAELLPWLEDADKSPGSHFYNTPCPPTPHLEFSLKNILDRKDR